MSPPERRNPASSSEGPGIGSGQGSQDRDQFTTTVLLDKARRELAADLKERAREHAHQLSDEAERKFAGGGRAIPRRGASEWEDCHGWLSRYGLGNGEGTWSTISLFGEPALYVSDRPDWDADTRPVDPTDGSTVEERGALLRDLRDVRAAIRHWPTLDEIESTWWPPAWLPMEEHEAAILEGDLDDLRLPFQFTGGIDAVWSQLAELDQSDQRNAFERVERLRTLRDWGLSTRQIATEAGRRGIRSVSSAATVSRLLKWGDLLDACWDREVLPRGNAPTEGELRPVASSGLDLEDQVDVVARAGSRPNYPAALDRWRAVKGAWRDDEVERRELVEQGDTVVANIGRDAALIAWARERNRYVCIGPGSDWANPFKVGTDDAPEDGTRDDVIALFEQYLGMSPSLKRKLSDLAGRVLGCHCHPEPCHGDVLVEAVTA